MKLLRNVLALFLVIYLMPALAAAGYWYVKDRPANWREADWTSAGILPEAGETPQATIHIFSAATGGMKGAVASHSWIVTKEANAKTYNRYDKVGWGTPVRRNGYAPDAYWYSNTPRVVVSVSGEEAARLIPKIEQAIAAYPYSRPGGYRMWPGPNSNTFVAAALAAAPELRARLPATAIGRDYPYDGRWFARTADGVRVSLGGYLGATVGLSGVEINVLGGAVALDFRRPAIELPGLGRFGLSPTG